MPHPDDPYRASLTDDEIRRQARLNSLDNELQPDVLLIQGTYQIPRPVFGPPGATSPTVPAVPAHPTGDFEVTLKGAMDEAFRPRATVSLYRGDRYDIRLTIRRTD